MFSEREQAFFKAIAISSLEVLQKENFKALEANELLDSFNECLDDYLYHFPLDGHPDVT